MNLVAIPRRTASGTTSGLADRREAGLGVRLHRRLADAEADWRAVEASAVLTPYQRYDWIAALLASGLEVPGHIAIAIIHDGGTPVGVLPLALDRHFGFTEARLIGTSLANGDWLACTAGIAATLTPERLMQLLRDIAQAAGGVDLIRFYNQPARWQGIDNPLLALSSMPAPNNLYFADLALTPLPYAEHHLPAKRRSNIRRGARRLEESLGPLELRRANEPAELERQHRTFLAQRAERFATMGIENLFGEPEFVRFFKILAARGFGQKQPALAFHALYAGDEIVATSIGACQGGHYSQYINSTASGPAAKYSLMGVLMTELLDELIGAGITSLDMGAGDFDYKTDWTAPQPMFHSVIALTPRGEHVKPMLGAGSALKRQIKQNPKLWGLAQAARRALYRLRHPR